MSGLPKFNFPTFEQCATALRAHGVKVVSPHEMGGEGEEGEAAWNKYLRADVVAMMECNAIVLLDGWPNSRGAKLELSIALALGFKVFYWKQNQLVIA